jgi:acyl-CoA synthetase (AMP-forming)/AMP-acid ligase II
LDGSKIVDRKPEVVNSAASDLAAVLFTSGSTGAPKGVCYEHGLFDAQVRLVRDTYGIQPGEVDLPMLPIFALFNPALGMTTIVPEIDPARPALVDPAKIIQAIQQEKVTNSFGSPTLWRIIFEHCLAGGIKLPSLRRVLCAGAAVPSHLWLQARRVLPNGELHSPYGATEVLPVATVSAREAPSEATNGALLGRPLFENRVKIIAPQEGPIATLDHARELPDGEIGEIIVTGPTVTKAYDALPEATALAKIQTANARRQTNPELAGNSEAAGVSAPSGAVWHRMGDAGYLDAVGRLWFCGRLAERVETAAGVLYTEPCEQVFRRHPSVARCALIGLGARGAQTAAIVVQPKGELADAAALARELRSLAQAEPHTAGITRFFFHSSLPVDVRHNAKIHRLTLARWAAGQQGHEVA